MRIEHTDADGSSWAREIPLKRREEKQVRKVLRFVHRLGRAEYKPPKRGLLNYEFCRYLEDIVVYALVDNLRDTEK